METAKARKRKRDREFPPSVRVTRATKKRQFPQWLNDLIESKTSITPILDESKRGRDFDLEHPIPHYLKGIPYWYSQGSSAAEVRRYFILPDHYMLYRYEYNDGTKRMRRVASITVKKLKEEALQKKERAKGVFQKLCWTKPYSHSLSLPGPSVNDVYLHGGPGPHTECEGFCSTTCAYGYAPDDVQIRCDHELVFCADLAIPLDRLKSGDY